MGWVVTLKQTSMGPKGTVRLVDAASERALIALGMVEGTTDPRLAPKPEPKPKRTYKRKVQEVETESETPKPKRTYRRKDMVAEESVEVVIQAQDLEPLENPLPDGDDETTVRV